MPRRRFSDIEKAQEFVAANTALQTYRNLSREAKQALYPDRGANSPVVLVAIQPFGKELAAGVGGIVARSNVKNRTQLSAAVGTHAVAPLPATAVRDGEVIPAVIRVFVKTGTATSKISKFTNTSYKKYEGTNYQHPFGQSTATEREFEAFNTISQAVLTATPTARVSFKPEGRRAQ